MPRAIKKYSNRDEVIKTKPFKYKVDESVRIGKTRTRFDRFYDEKWSNEVFTIISRARRDKINVYKLKDKLDANVRGKFYESELQRVTYDPKGEFYIDEVIKTVKNQGKENEEVLVSWYGWPKKFNSVVRKNRIVDL